MKKVFLKVFAGICTLIIITAGIHVSAMATSGTCGENLTWRIEENTLYINGTGAMTDYLSSYDAPWRFRQDVKEIVVGEGVTKIGEQAFRTCVYATKIELPDTLTEIGRWAFYQCEALTDINIPEGVVSIRYAAFGYCKFLKDVVIPDSVTVMEGSAFMNCSSLKNIKIGSGVTKLESYTFNGCFNMKSITIPDNVKEIKSTAFSGCTGLDVMNAPISLKADTSDLYYCYARVKYYYVIQYILNDELLKKEYVYEGDNAILPEAPTGYTYSFSEKGIVWDGTHINDNTIVYVTASKNATSTVEITEAEVNDDSIKYISTVEVSEEDEITAFGTVFIPLTLIDSENEEFAKVSYDNRIYDIKGSMTFGATLTDIPENCKELDILGRSYLELADGIYIWSAAKYVSVNNKELKLVEE